MLTNDALLKSFRTMLLIRNFEESLVDKILDGTIKTPCHLCSGQESFPAIFLTQLNSQDVLFGNHRSHGHYLAKGGDVRRAMLEIYCKKDGAAGGRGGSMHLIDVDAGMLGSVPIVAGTVSLALGAGMSLKLKGKGEIAVSVFGDGALGEGVVFESLNFAQLHKLPVMFVCENNLYSTHMPIKDTRPPSDITSIADSLNMASFTLDGSDPIGMMEASAEIINMVRQNIPLFLEIKTYRFRGHVGPDDNIQGLHTDIRPLEELEYWMEKDPIKKMSTWMCDHEILSESDIADMENEVHSMISDLHGIAVSAESPDGNMVCKHVYSD